MANNCFFEKKCFLNILFDILLQWIFNKNAHKLWKLKISFLKSHVVKGLFETFSRTRLKIPTRETAYHGRIREHSWREASRRHWNSLGDTFSPAVSHLGYVEETSVCFRTSSAIPLRSCSSMIKTVLSKEHSQGIEIEMRKGGGNFRVIVVKFINRYFSISNNESLLALVSIIIITL